MVLGNPDQGQRIASLVEELVRKDEEREAAAKGFDLGEFMEVSEADAARNAQEWERREAERERLRMQGEIAANEQRLPPAQNQYNRSSIANP